MRGIVRGSLGLLWLALALGAGWSCAGGGQVSSTSSAAPTTGVEMGSAARGAEVYAQHCAVCHGVRGRGDGASAYLLSPAPRDFGSTKFRLVSTVNGAPTEADLVQSIRRGMPGSAMPAWDWLRPCDQLAVARYVRELAVEGRADDLQRLAQEDDEELAREEALEIATRAMTPGAAIEIPPDCEGNAVDLAAGRRFFVENCALCHGLDGTGKGGADQINEDGTPAFPRDFTAGILKGGASHADIVRRMAVGLPGSPMPATEFKDPVLAAQVSAYVRSLIKPGVQERVVQNRRLLNARRIAGRSPTEPADPAWGQAEATWLPLMPLWWGDEFRPEGCEVRVLHDGQTLSVKLSWEDRARDDELLAQNLFTDAAALQFWRGEQPPLFTMGESGRPVNIWQWRAGWELDLERVRDVSARYPATPPDMYGFTDPKSAHLYLTARAAGNPMAASERRAAGEMLTAEGFGTLKLIAESDGKLTARSAWKSGYWDVVLTRPLAACCPGELPLTPGEALFMASAVWDGAAKDRNGQKAVTVWHVLNLEK